MNSTITERNGTTNANCNNSAKSYNGPVKVVLEPRETIYGINWSKVRVVYHPSAKIPGYALVDTSCELVIGIGSRSYCERFLSYWSSAIQSVKHHLEIAKQAGEDGDSQKKTQHIGFAKQAASKIDWNISELISSTVRRPVFADASVLVR